MDDIQQRIIGVWRLVHSIRIDPDGTTEYPLGEKAVGYIFYSDTGIMGVQISRNISERNPDRPPASEDYLAYFGKYEIDLKRGVVRHFVEGELFPGRHEEILERSYHFEGDLMSLKPVDGTHREILWQKVEALSLATTPRKDRGEPYASTENF